MNILNKHFCFYRFNIYLFFILFFSLLNYSTHAADFLVTKTEDTNDGICDEDCSLREAVIAANASLEGNNNIILSEGTYTLSIKGSDNDDSATGDLDFINPQENQVNIPSSVTVQGAGAKLTIIDTSTLGDRAFQVLATDPDIPLNITFNDISIEGANFEGSGAGIVALGNINNIESTLRLNRVNIHQNKASGIGAGLAAIEFAIINIDSSTFSENEAGFTAGGIFFSNVGQFSITNSTISKNSAEEGGGIVLLGELNDIPSIGRIFNSTITQNIAQGGGGIGVDDPVFLDLSNTIIANNTAPVIAKDCVFTDEAIVNSLGYNLVGDSTDCNFPNGGTGDQLDVEVLLEDLAENGGPTPTHAVPQDSLAYNAGNPDNCANGEKPGPEKDQRGQVRIAGGRCEIGAYESGLADLKILKTSNLQEIKVGENISYTLQITNLGTNKSFSNTFSDTLPIELEFISVISNDPSDICSFDANNSEITCDIGELESGESSQITIQAKLTLMPANETLTNTATVQSSETDSNLSNNSSSISIPVIEDNTVSGSGCSLTHNTKTNLFFWMALIGILFIQKYIKIPLQKNNN
ncbi:MAG: DUF11 domain-containing protein [Deltaproteobacteria bacterium]|nr:DUF11 domain-containing protein [Deltaproteobacteria bacterium]